MVILGVAWRGFDIAPAAAASGSTSLQVVVAVATMASGTTRGATLAGPVRMPVGGLGTANPGATSRALVFSTSLFEAQGWTSAMRRRQARAGRPGVAQWAAGVRCPSHAIGLRAHGLPEMPVAPSLEIARLRPGP
jgi:hypothetical protein